MWLTRGGLSARPENASSEHYGVSRSFLFSSLRTFPALERGRFVQAWHDVNFPFRAPESGSAAPRSMGERCQQRLHRRTHERELISTMAVMVCALQVVHTTAISPTGRPGGEPKSEGGAGAPPSEGPRRCAEADSSEQDRGLLLGSRLLLGANVLTAGRHGRRLCGAGPGLGRAQDKGHDQQLDADGEGVVEGLVPGRPRKVEHEQGDVQRCHNEVRGAVHTGGQRHGEQHHRARD